MTVSPQSLPTPHGQSDAAGRTPAPPGPAGGVNSFSRCGLEVAAGTNLRGGVEATRSLTKRGPLLVGARPVDTPGRAVLTLGRHMVMRVRIPSCPAGVAPGPRKTSFDRRRGREADCIGLENRRGAARRGFESHRLRRGHSSNGRASALQAEGCGFDPRWLHHIPACSAAEARLLWEQGAAGSIPATRTISRPLKLFRQRNFRSGKNVEGGRKIGIVKRDPGRNQVLMMSLAAEDGGLHQRVTRQGVIQRVPAGRWRAPARSNSSKGNNFALTRHLNTSCASEDRSDGGPDAEKFGPVLDPARSGFGHA